MLSRGGGGSHPQWKQAPEMSIDVTKQYTATIRTTEGTLTAQLLPEEAPKTVNNFVFLAREGFYDGVPFHRVIRGFMVQTGDPTGTGTGGPGSRFADEPVKRPYNRATVAMANAGPNTNGAQVCIMQQSKPLPPSYTVFGQVTQGLDALDAVANVAVSAGRSGESSVPQEEVKIERVTIREE